MKLTSNAKQIAARFLSRAKGTQRAVLAGLTAVAVAINKEQVENLSGSGDKGGFPVAVRSGHLRRSADMEVVGGANPHADVINTAVYAAKIHNSNGPFLEDARKKVNMKKVFASGFSPKFKGA